MGKSNDKRKIIVGLFIPYSAFALKVLQQISWLMDEGFFFIYIRMDILNVNIVFLLLLEIYIYV